MYWYCHFDQDFLAVIVSLLLSWPRNVLPQISSFRKQQTIKLPLEIKKG